MGKYCNEAREYECLGMSLALSQTFHISTLFPLIFPSTLPSRLYCHHCIYKDEVDERINSQINNNISYYVLSLSGIFRKRNPFFFFSRRKLERNSKDHLVLLLILQLMANRRRTNLAHNMFLSIKFYRNMATLVHLHIVYDFVLQRQS